MGYRVTFHPQAKADLFNLYAYIEAQSGPARAGNYIERIERFCASFAMFPERARSRDDLVPGLRTAAMERRVLIAFRINGDEVMILRALYAGLDWQEADIPH